MRLSVDLFDQIIATSHDFSPQDKNVAKEGTSLYFRKIQLGAWPDTVHGSVMGLAFPVPSIG